MVEPRKPRKSKRKKPVLIRHIYKDDEQDAPATDSLPDWFDLPSPSGQRDYFSIGTED